MSTVQTAIANFMAKQITFMESMDAKGEKPLRIWNKLLSKPKLDENGAQVYDEDGKPERELICDRNGEVIDDSSYILATSEALAKAFDVLKSKLSGTKEYCNIELLDPKQIEMNDDTDLKYVRFNVIKASFNDSTKTWELYTVRHKVAKTLSFSQCYRTAEVPVDADDEIDI